MTPAGNRIVAAVDGSSLGNPGPAGWAWVVDATCWDAGGWESGTNNLGELTAVLELLKATEAAGFADCELHILADSQYAINVISSWMHRWKKRGWAKADKKPIKNLELIQEIDRVIAGRNVTFEWVKGHAGHTMNELADNFARGCAEEYQAGRIPKPGPGFAGSGGETPATQSNETGNSGDDSASAVAEPAGSSPGSSSMEMRDGSGSDNRSRLIENEKVFLTAWLAGESSVLKQIVAPDCTRVWPNGNVTTTLEGPVPFDAKISRMTVTPAGSAWLVRYEMRWKNGASVELSVWEPSENSRGLSLVHHQTTLKG